MGLISAPSRSLTDRATLWTLAGCIGAALLLARLGAMDYAQSNDLFHPHGYCYLGYRRWSRPMSSPTP
jgi:hypothetical protein